jgi:NitT/TauT family transport system ATP-binding protein
MIELRGVYRKFQLPDGSEFFSVAGLEFSVEPNEIVSIVGKSGCGKSTCLNLMLGLLPPSEGIIRVDGVDPFREFDALRGRVGVVFQTDRLIPWRTTLENTETGLEILNMEKSERREHARYWLDRVGLSGFEDAFPYQLSGGMRQRAAIARAFTVNPDILFCDEAFGHLDVVTGAQLRATFLKLIEETRKTCVLITHSIAEAIEFSRRVLVFGKPARTLMDRRTSVRSPAEKNTLEEEIILAIEKG